MPDWIRQMFVNAASANGSRSSAMTPLQWVIAIAFAGAGGLTWSAGMPWYIALLLPAGLCVFYCVAYWHHMKNNPDALRSERYSLSKIAMEKGMIGDDRAGLLDPDTVQVEGGRIVQAAPRLSDESAPTTETSKEQL